MIAFGAVALSGCVDRAAQEQAKKTEEMVKDETVAVTVQAVSKQTLAETLEITGELATTTDSSIGSKVGGRLSAVYVQDGSAVSAGQVIAEIDSAVQRAQVQQAQQQVNAARSALNQAMTNARITPQRSAAAVATAQAQLRAAKAQLEKARKGARTEEVAQAQSRVTAAKSALETAKKDRDRAKSLYDQGATSQQRYEAAENAYQAALANYESALEGLRLTQNATRPEDLAAAEEQVRQAEENVRSVQAQRQLDAILPQQVEQARANLLAAQASLSMARETLSDTQIRSPFSGKVFGKPAQAGTVVNPGTPVARIVGKEGLYFEGDVPEGSISQIRQGGQVTVKLDALGDQSLTGHIVSVAASTQDVARIFRVRISLDNPPAGAIPGMFARGAVTLSSVEGADVVPSSAIVKDGADAYVYVVSGDTVKKTKVSIGMERDGTTQVIGLSEGTKVVVDGARNLTDGAKVKVQETPTA